MSFFSSIKGSEVRRSSPLCYELEAEWKAKVDEACYLDAVY